MAAAADVPGEEWRNLDAALRAGNRGLPASLSLAKLFSGRPAPTDVTSQGISVGGM